MSISIVRSLNKFQAQVVVLLSSLVIAIRFIFRVVRVGCHEATANLLLLLALVVPEHLDTADRNLAAHVRADRTVPFALRTDNPIQHPAAVHRTLFPGPPADDIEDKQFDQDGLDEEAEGQDVVPP